MWEFNEKKYSRVFHVSMIPLRDQDLRALVRSPRRLSLPSPKPWSVGPLDGALIRRRYRRRRAGGVRSLILLLALVWTRRRGVLPPNDLFSFLLLRRWKWDVGDRGRELVTLVKLGIRFRPLGFLMARREAGRSCGLPWRFCVWFYPGTSSLGLTAAN